MRLKPSRGFQLFLRRIHIWLFPLFEILSLVFAAQSIQNGTLTWIFWASAAGLALNFSVHITFHEFVHNTGAQETRLDKFLSFVGTALLGMPLDGYRLHHYNHHRYDNAPGDYSSTWIKNGENLQPRPWVSYIFGWPVQMWRARVDLIQKFSDGTLPLWIKHRLDREKKFLTVLYVALGILSWKMLGIYILVTYIGWMLVTLHNYGQHLPIVEANATSFQGTLYNKLFCNNGIHYEHHAEPRLAWYELAPNPQAPKIVALPHLAGPLFHLKKSTETI